MIAIPTTPDIIVPISVAKKKIMSAKTDSLNKVHFDEENQPGISNLMSIEQPSLSADLIDKLIKNQNIPNWVTYDFLSRNIEDSGNSSA